MAELTDPLTVIAPTATRKNQKPKPEPHPSLDALTEDGIELKMVVFVRTVTSAHGSAETAFYSGAAAAGHKPYRTAQLWYTPHGIVCHQLSDRGLYELFIVPPANVTYMKLQDAGKADVKGK